MSAVCWLRSLTAITDGSLDVQEMSAHFFPSMTFSSVRSCVTTAGVSPAAHRPSAVSFAVISFEIAVRTQEESKGNARVTAGSTSDIVYKITYRNIASLEETVKLVEPQVLERAVDLICRADSVLLFGLGASQLVAKDAYLKFIRIDKPCSCCEDIHSQYVIAKNSKPNDVAIVISYSGRTEEIVRCAEYLKAQGTPIIAITRFELSPISRMAACCLNVMASEELYRSGAMSSRIAQLNMIDILYTACINRNISQNVRMFSHNRLDTERA